MYHSLKIMNTQSRRLYEAKGIHQAFIKCQDQAVNRRSSGLEIIQVLILNKLELAKRSRLIKPRKVALPLE